MCVCKFEDSLPGQAMKRRRDKDKEFIVSHNVGQIPLIYDLRWMLVINWDCKVNSTSLVGRSVVVGCPGDTYSLR